MALKHLLCSIHKFKKVHNNWEFVIISKSYIWILDGWYNQSHNLLQTQYKWLRNEMREYVAMETGVKRIFNAEEGIWLQHKNRNFGLEVEEREGMCKTKSCPATKNNIHHNTNIS